MAAAAFFFSTSLLRGLERGNCRIEHDKQILFRSEPSGSGTRIAGDALLKFALPYGSTIVRGIHLLGNTFSRRHDNHLSLVEWRRFRFIPGNIATCRRCFCLREVHQLIADPVNASPATRGHRRLTCRSGIDDFPARFESPSSPD